MSVGNAVRPSRRDVLLGSVALTGLGIFQFCPNPVLAAESRFDRFMALSRELTGRSHLDPQTGKLYFLALLQSEKFAPLLERRLIALANDAAKDDAGTADLEGEILDQWYTGVYSTGASDEVATYEGALAWQAMALRGPPGMCHGELGFWSRPPDL